MIARSIKCDVCGTTQQEDGPGRGFPGWGDITGVRLNGVANPNLCPKHLAAVMGHVEKLIEGVKNGVD